MILLQRFLGTLTVVATLVALPSAAPGQVFDLTGTWEGRLTCKSFDTGLKRKFILTPALFVTQIGNAVGARLDFGGGAVDRYTGLANADGKKPLTKGELALIRCGTDDAPGGATGIDEIGRFAATTKAPPAIKAALKGTSIFSDAGNGAPEVATCVWKWARTGLGNPGVSTSCP